VLAAYRSAAAAPPGQPGGAAAAAPAARSQARAGDAGADRDASPGG
jgi:hypothetical protein